jgi:hypothetical protein
VSLLDVINHDFQHQGIYVCLSEPPLLTVIIGARCSDGVVLVADKQLTDIFGKPPEFRDKLSGDIGHFLVGYTGLEEIFHIFRKSIVGDLLLVSKSDPYTFDNFITRCCPVISALNRIACKPVLEVLVVKHQWSNTQLYHIDDKGRVYRINDYIAVGSGYREADNICKSLPIQSMTMKDFVKRAYFAIMFMNQYHPGLGVGVEPDGIPSIKYMYYDKEWDREPAKDSPQDIEDCKKYTEERLEQIKNMTRE